MIHFILGGARSGKSRFAEQQASTYEINGRQVCYIATAKALDEEMSQRIEKHQLDRPKHWRLIEADIDLASTVNEACKHSDCILIDCLTLWLSHCLCQYGDSVWQAEKAKFLALLNSENLQGKQVLIVSNEVGQGIVPLGELSRQFVDQSGWLHQDVAELAKRVDFIVAGLPMSLKNIAEDSQ